MPAAAPALPTQLRGGDRLSGSEFLRRWEAMPQLKRAELIGGVVFMRSHVGFSDSDVHSAIHGLLWYYKELTPGCQTGLECTWVMCSQDVPQPDIFLRILPEYGGQSGPAGKYASGTPELIVEITGSSVSRDLGVKLELYRRAGVREYLTVMLHPRQIIRRQLARGRYRDMKPDENGLLQSVVFPGL